MRARAHDDGQNVGLRIQFCTTVTSAMNFGWSGKAARCSRSVASPIRTSVEKRKDRTATIRYESV